MMSKEPSVSGHKRAQKREENLMHSWWRAEKRLFSNGSAIKKQLKLLTLIKMRRSRQIFVLLLPQNSCQYKTKSSH
jgi:hypothetical protein